MNMQSRRQARRFQLSAEKAQEHIDQIEQAYTLLDSALLHSARMATAIIETGSESGLDQRGKQELFQGFQSHVTTILESRQSLLKAHGIAHRVRLKSNQAETDFGCLWELGEATAAPTAQLRSVA